MAHAPWLLLQLADGAFPNGAFAHSAGLEAAAVLGGLESATAAGAAAFLDTSLRQVGRAQLPFVRASALAARTRTRARARALDDGRMAAIDEAFDATLPLRGPNLASRAQGRALVSAASRVWDATADLAAYAHRGPCHHAPMFGSIFGLLGAEPTETLAAYLHGAARGILSAAVRLGLLGPIEAQRLLAERAPLLEQALEDARELAVEDAAQTAPLLEIFAALHDRLDGRMFQS